MVSLFSARRKPGWMAVVSQGGSVTLTHVLRKPNAPPLVTLLDIFAVDKSETAALQRLRVARRLKLYACTTLMAQGDYSLTQLENPAVPTEERKEALRWSLKDVVSFPLDRACLDVLDIPADGMPSGRSPGVLVVAADEQAVRARVAPFEQAGIALDAVDIPELAQRNVAALLEDQNRGLAFLRIDESGMMLTLTFHGELIAVRRGEVNTQQLAGPQTEQRQHVTERLVLDLQRSLDNFDRQYSHIPISKVVVACHPQVDGLIDELGASTYVPVREMDLATVMDFPAIPELRDSQRQAKYLLAIGAALRTTEASA